MKLAWNWTDPRMAYEPRLDNQPGIFAFCVVDLKKCCMEIKASPGIPSNKGLFRWEPERFPINFFEKENPK